MSIYGLINKAGGCRKKLMLTYIGVIFSVLITGCSFSNKNETKVRDKYQVTYPITVDTSYNIDYVSDIHSIKNIEIRARVKGYIEAIHVDEGKPVKKGQVIFSISKQEYQEEVLKANANLKNAIAEAKAAELELQNVKLLVAKNVVSKTEMEMAQARLDAFNAKIEEAKSHAVSAQLKLSFTEIRAPFDGVIDRIPNKVGSLVDEGTLLTTLSDNHEVYAYFNVSEKEYLEFQHDENKRASSSHDEVSLILANNKEHAYKGNVETVEGEIDNETGSIAFRARFPNPDKILKHGSSGKIRLRHTLHNAIVIPQKSTLEIQDKVYVFVVDNQGKVKMKNFVPKMRIPHLYILESGLSTTDKIIYEGIQDVKDGMIVNAEVVPMKDIIVELANE
ncbi:MAG TPA: efflux RND transporter periplasmic adaptor subunit [Cytophagaceae bacterium]|nr:efflux RND transporter periplasmic adaptor subunit [Cytophagaceae bacterium]